MTRTMTASKPKRNTPGKYPCVFRSEFLIQQIDPRIKADWPDAPFGNLRRIWRDRHCKTLNPYGSDDCPYDQTECAMAFYQTATYAHQTAQKPVAYFWRSAHSRALQRADEKPSARRSGYPGAAPVHHRQGPPGDVPAGLDPQETLSEPGLRRTLHRPVSLGDVLRSLDVGSRERRTDDGKESPE